MIPATAELPPVQPPAKNPLLNLTPDGRLQLHLHPGQLRAWDSIKQIVAVVAGTRSGKTCFGPLWAWREMRRCGPGDGLVAAPTFPLLDKGAAPELELVLDGMFGLGKLRKSPLQFVFSNAGMYKLWGVVPPRRHRIIFGHGDDPESMEAMTAKWAWLDEAGQKRFKIGSYEAAQRRLQIDRGRMLITTTPYSMGWLKQKLHDPWKAAKGQHPEIDLIRFESRMNPAFPKEEWERAKRDLPGWKFDLFYRAIFTRPAGMIYDCFDADRHVVPRFAIPETWPRYLGLDFGGVNTAGIFLAEEMTTPSWKGEQAKATGRFFAYREYLAGGRTAKQHADELKKGEPRIPRTVGGAKSEDQWRNEFRQAGLPVLEAPVSEVEIGIDRVYGAIKADELLIFSDLTGLLDEIGSYSRETDEMGQPTEKIEDKEDFHRLDAARYIISSIKGGRRRLTIGV